jgi:uncharacterized membrane protein
VIYVLALVIGIVAGLRSMLALAAVSWGMYLGAFDAGGTWLGFLGKAWAPWIFSALAIGELISDQLPTTPSRTTPLPFAARLFSGALAGAAVAAGAGRWVTGAVLGAVGAVIGTLGGRAVRARLATAFGQDRPAAFLEDAVAVVVAVGVGLVAA